LTLVSVSIFAHELDNGLHKLGPSWEMWLITQFGTGLYHDFDTVFEKAMKPTATLQAFSTPRPVGL
jgi:hypothetical protein